MKREGKVTSIVGHQVFVSTDEGWYPGTLVVDSAGSVRVEPTTNQPFENPSAEEKAEEEAHG